MVTPYGCELESVTPSDLVDGEPNGLLLVDCACGWSYRVAAGLGEGDRLDAAQADHERLSAPPLWLDEPDYAARWARGARDGMTFNYSQNFSPPETSPAYWRGYAAGRVALLRAQGKPNARDDFAELVDRRRAEERGRRIRAAMGSTA